MLDETEVALTTRPLHLCPSMCQKATESFVNDQNSNSVFVMFPGDESQ